LLLGFCGSTSHRAFAQSTPIFGQPYTFGIGPRAIGMGGAFVAIADDASAAYWNVAGLAQISSYEISLSSAPNYFYHNQELSAVSVSRILLFR
jgi:hypothetical protein